MSLRRPSIVLTVHTLGQGGTDRVCAHLARGFAEAGYDTEVVALATGGAGTEALLPLFGPRVLLTFLGQRGGSRAADLVRRFPVLVRHLARTRPDYVLSTGNNMNWITALAVRAAGIDAGLVLKTTNPIIRPKDTWLSGTVRRLGYTRAFAAADAVLTLSDAETRQLRGAFPGQADRFQTVANPYVTPQMLNLLPVQHGPARLILGVGRLSAQKRFDLLLAAFAQLNDQTARLAILGEGPDRAMLQRQADDLGIADRVEMPGFVSDVAGWFARADLFVLSSRYEGLPAVVLEAMAANCPVVSTDCFPAARELVGAAESCAVVTGADPDTLAERMAASLLAPRPLRLAGIASRYAVDTAVRDHIGAIAGLRTAPAFALPSAPVIAPVPA